MKKVIVFLTVLLLIMGSSCRTLQQEESYVFDDNYEDKVTDYEVIVIGGTEVKLKDGYVVEPKSNLDIEIMAISDFGSYFETKYDVTVDSYKLMKGSIAETTVYHIHSKNAGPTVYVAAGTHGNERAGWYAGILLRKATISCGDLYVLAPVNANGAKNMTRYVTGTKDPNRSYPGKVDGDLTDRLCYAVFNDIAEKKPDIVLDLHEAIVFNPSETNFLGSTYIFSMLDNMDDVIFDMLWATEDGDLCHNAFSLEGPGPIGSLNKTVSDQLGIPTITVETFRGYDINRRVQDQLATVEYVLDYKGMR